MPSNSDFGEAPERYPEGARKQICVNAIERNRQARDACVRHHGLDCVVCGFNFQLVYGQLGERFILVQHLVPVGDLHGEHMVDPACDLVPVCPNCHAMIHRVTPPLKLKYNDSLTDAVRSLGQADQIQKCFAGFQKYLYAVSVA